MNNVKALKTISMIPLGLAVPIGLLMWLGWRRPLWGGILLFFLAVLASINFSDALRGQGWLAPFLIIIAPLLLSGLILLIAAGLERKAT
jgi:hypothetical protein